MVAIGMTAQGPALGLSRTSRSTLRATTRPQASAASNAAAALPELGGGVPWTAEVTHHTLTMPQILQHLEQLDKIEAAAGQRHAHGLASNIHSQRQHPISWVEQHGTADTTSLLDGMLSESDNESPSDGQSLYTLSPHLLTEAQQAAVVLQAWQNAVPTKPDNFDAEAQLLLPGLADVAVVSRGGWQRHSWKGCNQDSFLALPLAAVGVGCQDPADPAACCSAAVAIGVFDGHGRAGQAASAHLRNALASGLLMHSQLALMAHPACQPSHARSANSSSSSTAAPAGTSCAPAAGARSAEPNNTSSATHIDTSSAAQPGTSSAAAVATSSTEEEAAQLLERCFAAAASTMSSTGADFSLSGSTAVMCLVQPGSVTAAWAGDSRAVLGLRRGQRYIACALTHDHRPSSPLERARIEAAGGWVMQTQLDEEGRPCGPHRVYLRDTNIPGLAVSRGFGDYVATGAGVTSTPDVTTMVLPTSSNARSASTRQDAGQHSTQSRRGSRRGHSSRQQANAAGSATQQLQQQAQQQRQEGRRRQQGVRPGSARSAQQHGAQQHRASASRAASCTASSRGQHILIVASDGLWEFVSNAEAVRIASSCSTAQAAADSLALEAQAQWAVKFGGAVCDDITVAVAFLPGTAVKVAVPPEEGGARRTPAHRVRFPRSSRRDAAPDRRQR